MTAQSAGAGDPDVAGREADIPESGDACQGSTALCQGCAVQLDADHGGPGECAWAEASAGLHYSKDEPVWAAWPVYADDQCEDWHYGEPDVSGVSWAEACEHASMY